MSHETLRDDLRRIAAQATRVLGTERRHRRQPMAIAAGFAASTIAASGYLAYLGIAHWTGSAWPVATLPSLLGIVLAPGLLLFCLRLLLARQSASRQEALAAVDARHDLADRLRTADEFLGRTHRSAFMAAALLDATEHARRLGSTPLQARPAPRQLSRPARRAALLTLLFVALALWIPDPVSTSRRVTSTDPPGIAALRDDAKIDKATARERPEDPRPEEPRTETSNQTLVKPATGTGRKDAQLDSSIKKTRGVMGSGQSADAASSSGTSEARGAPSSQAQASKAGKKPTRKKKVKPKKRKPPDSTPNVAKKPETDSGATAGRGAASGSNKSPSASPWSSKDQVTSEDEDDLEDDEEVDDEFDNSDARGGVQPHLRDRRPPVNRDLGIGFGNNKNPDANGRGGPSEMKKSRGVASLVLGVPIPDHVKGRPNPGKTKITQERVEPKVEDAPTVEATARQPRRAPVGHFANPELEPWMRDLIRTYFKAIRLPSPRTPSPQTPSLQTPSAKPKKSGD
jgi:hypothetical protein